MSMRRLLPVAALAVGALVWLPLLHVPFARRAAAWRPAPGTAVAGPVPARVRELQAAQVAALHDAARRRADLVSMRATNAEWDFMGRTFLGLALANLALREPAARAAHLRELDALIDETLRLEAQHGPEHFLMGYVRRGPFVVQPARSLFIDGEIALVLAARRLVEEKPEYVPLLGARVEALVARMRASPVLSGESYPDECWTFCNTVALAAIRLADALDGTDHGDLARAWVATARQRLTDPKTGLLVSSFRVDGTHLDGPEGSSIWMASHMLQLVDPAFAADQYRRARAQLGRSFLGFGYAREWPVSWVGRHDVDSGAVIPVLEAGIGSSGLALVGAAAAGDEAFLRSLVATLEYAGFPTRAGGRVRFAAGNQVGDAVLLYALTLGPLWDAARTRRPV
jgi:hypothetical protein